eukprot:TRINITY_DN848_c0_g1_i1.p1 TRINITY_DN848_c0_g1~~TRINITY_DN848_c0_g1_i1.p1  ORF type:complete len:318 (+),score=65.43 TRINITY_DN848_c0_g1_i1:204-1157(+)
MCKSISKKGSKCNFSIKKYVIITGANNGIGKECAKVLAKKGANVILASRNNDKNEEACEEIRGDNPKGEIMSLELDLSSFESIDNFVERYLELNVPLNCIIANAGIMGIPTLKHVENGIEIQWMVNYLGHFYLIMKLMPKLVDSVDNHSDYINRIIMLSSVAHKNGTIDVEDINYDKKKYFPFGAYANSKLACLILAKELNRRFEHHGILSCSVHPGVVNTDLTQYNTRISMVYKLIYPFLKTVEQGAATSSYVATANNIKGGSYYVDCKEYTSSKESNNRKVGNKLWNLSFQQCNLSEDILSNLQNKNNKPIRSRL